MCAHREPWHGHRWEGRLFGGDIICRFFAVKRWQLLLAGCRSDRSWAIIQVNNEKGVLEKTMELLQTQEHRRSRQRVMEILKLVEDVSAEQIKAAATAEAEGV